MGRGHVGSKVSFAAEKSVLSKTRVQTMCQLSISYLVEGRGRGERSTLFHLSTLVKRLLSSWDGRTHSRARLLRLKKKWAQHVLHNESWGQSQAISEGEAQAGQPSCRQDRRLKYRPGRWAVRQQVWKRSGKEVVVREGFQFLHHPNCSQTDSWTSR